ncbi:ABC-type antimicrobial peptide transport system, ATPase component [Brachybacterium faecium DSM 4810]|uniref:ABC-type antimicrobial peptide transport system, ATPase component n=1 Tax=Brachybacterium faecium (strain ATCC 43885 / DSM 4810 / JCM 11609 / LMG 19847 / NBRC 14762 / NCIMB 9860 / 6-10) TaxID=446465 RepID=C7MI61_BRAFD|nr:ABC-type antimicrobial peptide transport system, ATPase component [Brachybacterium faecium DSM 4810]
MTALLEMRAVTRVHGHGAREVTALRGVDLAVQPGEFVALMGPSGSGKSTLLHLAGGLALPTSGEVLVDGKSLTGLSPAERAVLRRDVLGYVFQELNLLPGLTALENVAFPLELAGLRTRPARAAALGALAEVGIEELASRMPAELSGGQSQRVAIARSLVGPRRLLLADEPTGALDSMSGRDIIALLRGRADAGAGVVLVTHEPRFAAWADRTLQLRDGDVVGVAAPEVTPWSA